MVINGGGGWCRAKLIPQGESRKASTPLLTRERGGEGLTPEYEQGMRNERETKCTSS